MSRLVSIHPAVVSGLIIGVLLGGVTVTEAAGGVAVSGNTTTITGTGEATREIELATGVYTVTWSTSAELMSVSLNDSAGEAITVFGLGGPKGAELFAIDGEAVKPGKMKLEVESTAAWTVTIVKAVAAGAVALPQTLTGPALGTVISKAFKADAGTLKVAYTYKSEPKGTGSLRMYDAATGKNVAVDAVMYAGNAAGELEVRVPAAGVYVASTTFPLGSGGGDVRLKQ